MEGSVTNIILTAEHQQQDKPDYENLYTDVIVQFDNGDKYHATFMSYKSLEDIISDFKETELNSMFYKILDVVLIRDFNNGDLMPIIESMLSEGDFQLVFKKM